MEREWGNRERFILYISSFSLYIPPLYLFPISNIVSFCRKMLNTALLSRMSQKNYHMRCEKIILGRDCCEKAPQDVRAWCRDDLPTPVRSNGIAMELLGIGGVLIGICWRTTFGNFKENQTRSKQMERRIGIHLKQQSESGDQLTGKVKSRNH